MAGTVFRYEGRPSGVLASVRAAPADGAYAMTVIDRDGVSPPVGVCPVAGGHGTLSAAPAASMMARHFAHQGDA